MTIKRVAAVALLLLAGHSTTYALDVRLRDVQCEDYPVKIAADSAFKIVCPESGVDSTRCSFNGDTAYLSGNFLFDGVSSDVAYMTSNLQFVSLEYLLTKNQQVDLCDETWIQPIENYDADAAADAEAAQGDDGAANDDGGERVRWLEEGAADGDDAAAANGDDGGNNQCDLADGYYSFELGYVLPDYQDNLSWFATGWRGTGFVKMYADDSGMDESLIGSCQFTFDTMVTQSSDGGITVPTAAMTIAIIAGVFALGALLCCYMKFCRGRKRQVAAPSDKTVGGEYKRTEDDGTFISSKDGTASQAPPSTA